MTDWSSVLAEFDDREIDYIFARSECVSDNAALEKTGLSYGWFRNRDKELLNDTARQLRIDTAFKASRILKEAAEEAARVLVQQLDLKRNPNVQQRAAVEVLDRSVGKPSQKVEQQNSGESKLTIEFINDWRDAGDED